MTEKVECVVVGGGVVGLACARALALGGREVLILEQADTIGTGTSARNSEVIHAGIYYPKGSLKARLCVKGRNMLYAYCASHGIGHQRLGKLIVASEEDQIPELKAVQAKGEANGVDDLRWLDRNEARALEPAVKAAAAILSPSTGIIDIHALMLSTLGEAESRGAVIAYNSRVLGGRVRDDGIELQVESDGSPMTLRTKILINSAGHGAQALAGAIEGVPPATIPRRYAVKGNYFVLSGKSPFRHLIYPAPQKNNVGLGIHLGLDLGGQVKFGPDVEWPGETWDGSMVYTVDPARAAAFYRAIRTYWPDLEDGRLQPGFAGIRPKIQGPDDPAADFVIQGEETHRIQGLINLYGIESPGLTSSPAIAEEVAERLS
ncbi:MAG: NAD(P)/FAD-dependent oxidoreductase [Rhodospirillales bacterium]|nr:NAD(P)/FAD-dependent oxidoreductase [Rhodospirillales bacterium]